MLPGSWSVIEISDKESQWKSQLKCEVALLNPDKVSIFYGQSFPREPVGETDTIDLFAFLDPHLILSLCPCLLPPTPSIPNSLLACILRLFASAVFFPSFAIPSQRPWKEAGQIPLSL